ncbi:MAG: ABC transporter substrate-binding protein [Methanothrix sp.]|nr:ABC transporter substrate-binding protein [Methanothrix sp.]
MFRIFASMLLLGIFLCDAGSSAKSLSATQAPAKVELLYCKGVNLMPMLLATGQIDGYFAWQPYLSMAEKSGIGKSVVPSKDFPPGWQNHPCCILVASDRLLDDHLDLVSAFSYLNILAVQWVRENPQASTQITADWLMGSRNYTLGESAMPSQEVFEDSRPTLVFSTEPNDTWRRSMDGLIAQMISLLDTSTGDQIGLQDISLFDPRPYSSARAMIPPGKLDSPKPMPQRLLIGYLMIDHQAPLFAAVKNWKYFYDRYGIALKPQDDAKRPSMIDLVVEGEKVAEVELVTAPTGQTLMTLMNQGCLDMAYCGITPAIGSILLGGEDKIILPVQNEGSGLVLQPDSNVRGWEDFVALARDRSAKGRPLKLGDPDLGTITDVILQAAFNESGIQGVKA